MLSFCRDTSTLLRVTANSPARTNRRWNWREISSAARYSADHGFVIRSWGWRDDIDPHGRASTHFTRDSLCLLQLLFFSFSFFFFLRRGREFFYVPSFHLFLILICLLVLDFVILGNCERRMIIHPSDSIFDTFSFLFFLESLNYLIRHIKEVILLDLMTFSKKKKFLRKRARILTYRLKKKGERERERKIQISNVTRLVNAKAKRLF